MPHTLSLTRNSVALLAVPVLLGCLGSSAVAAIPQGMSVSVQPIVGYERQRFDRPDRENWVLVYGGRVTAGWKLLSAEAEYTRGKSEDVFPTTSTRIQEETQKVRLGLRSTFGIASMLDWFFRAGAEGQRRHTTRTVAGVTTESDAPEKVYPYAGTGLSIRLGRQLNLEASGTATIRDTSDLSQNEYSTSLGLRLNIGT